VLVALRMAAVAALLRHRVAAVERAEQQRGYAVIDGFEQTTAEVAAAMNLSPAGASYLVSYAEALDKRLPQRCGSVGRGPNRLAHRAIDHQPHRSRRGR
jgi:Domain of unknown function (DUF222)